MNSAHRVSQFPAKPPRWHKLLPVGTDIADDSFDLAPLSLNFVLQGRWVIGDQVDSGHLLLQDDETDRYISACWASAAQSVPATNITLLHNPLLTTVGRASVRALSGRSL